jgi:predicted lactoylglutathione lyase
MKTKKIWAKLGVTDLNRITKFYSVMGVIP